jgi:hypothetical protein
MLFNVILLLSFNTAAVAVVMTLSTILQRNTVENCMEHVSRLFFYAGFESAIHMDDTLPFGTENRPKFNSASLY